MRFFGDDHRAADSGESRDSMSTYAPRLGGERYASRHHRGQGARQRVGKLAVPAMPEAAGLRRDAEEEVGCGVAQSEGAALYNCCVGAPNKKKRKVNWC